MAININTNGRKRIFIQSFSTSQSLCRPLLISLLFERNTYTRLQSSGFRLNDRIVCIVEDKLIKFHSLYNLGRVIDTSVIFSAATNKEVSSFAADYSNLFDIADVDEFVANTNRNARKYLTSLIKSEALQNLTAHKLQKVASANNLTIQVSNNKIIMPDDSRGITELLRFLNDGRYIGPVSGNTFIANSRRRVN